MNKKNNQFIKKNPVFKRANWEITDLNGGGKPHLPGEGLSIFTKVLLFLFPVFLLLFLSFSSATPPPPLPIVYGVYKPTYNIW